MPYESERQYVEGVRRFVRGATRTGSPIVIAVPGQRLERLKDELAGELERVELVDMSELGANPARIVPAIRAAIDAHPQETVHVVAEVVWEGRSGEEIAEALRHEALINRAFADDPVEILCPYDISVTEPRVISDAERAHPCVQDGEGTRRSASYSARGLPAGAEAPLPEPPAHATSLRFGLADLVRVRSVVSEEAARADLTLGQCGEVVLAVNELATNSVQHGGGTGVLQCWHEHGRLTCQISDSGRIRDPLAGRVRPAPGARGGRGLWLVNQLCDLVQIRTGPRGTAVRIHAARRGTDESGGRALVTAHARVQPGTSW
ncbi:MAG: sensor histidine kinase [Acidobacteriota bacterium]|nr:sensor histidine kinase [Acidobacteriota bacterium]